MPLVSQNYGSRGGADRATVAGGKPKETIEAAHKITIEDLVMAAMRVEEEDRKAAGDLPN